MRKALSITVLILSLDGFSKSEISKDITINSLASLLNIFIWWGG